MNTLYPLKFQPIFKDKIWGGRKIKDVLGMDFGKLPNCGEVWVVSGVEGNPTLVKNGFLAGNELNELVSVYMGDLVGDEVYEKYGDEFPLLIKYIDANDDLSIQVHPDDTIAAKKHQSFGKNELWHIVQADEGAALYIGFKPGTTKKDYIKALQQGDLALILNKIQVKAGDTFYIPAGTVHAIGKGVLLAEVQQSSDITYRIFDWNRMGLDGKPRELHTELALDAINFKAQPDKRNEAQITTPYFQIRKIDVSASKNIDISSISGFIILMNTGKGHFTINGIDFKKGKTLLISANSKQLIVNMLKTGHFLMISIL